MTIDDRQVTLALFRQLVEEDLIASHGGGLNGVPWGWVNYHPDRCADDGQHRHVVWQKGDELRRATIYRGFGTFCPPSVNVLFARLYPVCRSNGGRWEEIPPTVQEKLLVLAHTYLDGAITSFPADGSVLQARDFLYR
jgi:hypothetical protein